jgi:hypothetical protein
MNNDRTIIGAAIVIAAIGGLEYMLSDEPNSRALMVRLGGALGVALILSALAAIGEGPAKVAAGLAVLTAVTVGFIDAPTILGFAGSIGSPQPNRYGGTPTGGPQGS